MPPNFLVFVTDQMQSRSLGCNGNPEVRTPAIDRLAADGATFRRAYCSNSVCMPSRSTMITGLTPRGHGCISNGTCLPEHVPTVPQVLADAGYRTHSVGKLHLQPFGASAAGTPSGETPASWEDRNLWEEGRISALPRPYYGFQTTDFVGGHVNYCFGDYGNWLRENHPGVHQMYARQNAYETREGAPSCWRMPVPRKLHYNTWIAERAIEFMRASGDAPFFLWCSFPDPHFPFAACRPYSEMYDPDALGISPTWDLDEDPLPCLAQRRRRSPRHGEFTEEGLREITAQTYGMISHVDDCIGRVLGHLEEAGLEEDTVVVFMADHGEYLGAHHLLYKSSWPYEELVNVPFIWRAPDGAGGGVRREVVSLLDFAPTALDYAGVEQEALNMRGLNRSEWPGLPGRSLRSALEGAEALPPEAALIENDEDWFPGPMWRPRTLVEGRHKLALFPGREDGLLFDLQEDPHETRNLWDEADAAPVKCRMLESLARTLTRTDRLDTERISGA